MQSAAHRFDDGASARTRESQLWGCSTHWLSAARPQWQPAFHKSFARGQNLADISAKSQVGIVWRRLAWRVLDVGGSWVSGDAGCLGPSVLDLTFPKSSKRPDVSRHWAGILPLWTAFKPCPVSLPNIFPGPADGARQPRAGGGGAADARGARLRAGQEGAPPGHVPPAGHRGLDFHLPVRVLSSAAGWQGLWKREMVSLVGRLWAPVLSM